MHSNHPIFSRFPSITVVADGKYHYDFLGVRTDPAFWKNIRPQAPGRIQLKPPGHGDWYFEWIGLLSALHDAETAGRGFTMMELGAGWGQWIVRAGVHLNRNKIEHELIAVEGDPVHWKFIVQHFKNNDLDPSRHSILCGIVGTNDKGHFFMETETPAQDYATKTLDPGKDPDRIAKWLGYPDVQSIPDGTSIKTPSGYRVRKMKSYDLRTMIRDHETVNLIHIDVQGAEAVVIPHAIDEIKARVRRLIIGTHSPEIDDLLFSLFSENGFKAEFKFGWREVADTDFGEITFADGCQIWVNTDM